MKYTLPTVEELKELGFKFEFNTLDEFPKYANEFVKENDDKLFKILIPDFDPDEYEETVKLDSCSWYEIQRAEEKIKRLASGIIEKDDYRFVVHPVHKRKPDVLISAWTKRMMKFGLESKALLYYPKVFGLTPIDAIHETLLNELYRIIIYHLPQKSFEPPLKKEESTYQDQINILEYNLLHSPPKSKIKSARIRLSIDKIKEAMYEDFFSKSISQPEKVSRFFYRIISNFDLREINRMTNLDDKQLIIKYYLKKQTSIVSKSKNTRGKGLQLAKKNRIIKYIADNPDANNSKVARALKVSRNTVRKYRTN